MLKSAIAQKKGKALRLFLRRLIGIVFLLLLVGGCAKKPAPPPPPSPMTVDYLLAHMQVKDHPAFSQTTIEPLPLVQHLRFHDANATLTAALIAQIDTASRNGSHPCTPVNYLLLFTLKATAWGAFDTAIDTLGNRLRITPYSSNIRQGIFYDNFYLTLSRDWLEKAAKENVEILLVNKKHELGFTLPTVYPEALKRYIDLYLSLKDSECQ